MELISRYDSPLGGITLAADGEALTGLWIDGQKDFGRTLAPDRREGDPPVLRAAAVWLDGYFSGKDPGSPPPLRPAGTEFQREVWAILSAIPYGSTTTYGQIAELLAGRRGVRTMSAQAVGNAVGKNPISILIPCHRVLGADGSLTGYAGGLDKKYALLRLEGVIREEYHGHI